MPQLLCAIEAAAGDEEEAVDDAADMGEAAGAGGGAAAGGASGDALRAVTAEDKDALDFGVVAVYTCSASCALHRTGAAEEAAEASGYAVEYVWHQPLE